MRAWMRGDLRRRSLTWMRKLRHSAQTPLAVPAHRAEVNHIRAIMSAKRDDQPRAHAESDAIASQTQDELIRRVRCGNDPSARAIAALGDVGEGFRFLAVSRPRAGKRRLHFHKYLRLFRAAGKLDTCFENHHAF